MKVYLRGYARRWKNILLAVLCVLVALLLSCVLFQSKLNKISGQLNSYDQAEYSLIYVLNYEANLDNEFIYPDTDTQIYLDKAKTKRLTVSSVMRDDSAIYSEVEWSSINNLGYDELIISKNVSGKYGVGVGESLFVEFPYSSDLREFTIKGIARDNYDFTNPNIDNDIGIVYLGYDGYYESNTQCKYIAFSKHSEAEILSEYPQIIDTVINKSDNEDYVFQQGLYILLFQSIFVIIAIILAFMGFYVKSNNLLKRCYLKGMKKIALIWMPFLEKILFAEIPAIIMILAISYCIPMKSMLSRMYFVIPVFLIGVFCVGTVIVEMIKVRRKGG